MKLAVAENWIENSAGGEYRPSSGRLRANVETFCIEVRSPREISRGAGWSTFELKDVTLPDPSGGTRPVSIAERPEIFWTLVAVADSTLFHQKGSKSVRISVSKVLRVALKTFEYVFLNGYFRVADVPRGEWDRLRAKLARGRWIDALDIQGRTLRLMERLGPEATQLLVDSKRGNRVYSVPKWVLRELGTSVSGRELPYVRDVLLQGITQVRGSGVLSPSHVRFRVPNVASYAMLSNTLLLMNRFADVAPPLGISVLPNPNPHVFALTHGGTQERTGNFTPSDLAAVLCYAYEWILGRGELICDWVRALGACMPATLEVSAPRGLKETSWNTQLSSARRSVLMDLPETRAVEAAVGRRITTLAKRTNQPGEGSFCSVLDELLSSCFVVLALMNARRKDEISGKDVGLHSGSMIVLDPHLNLAECEFYVEKTTRDYVPFLVNRISQAAIKVLEEIADVAWGWAELSGCALPVAKKGRKLFVYPNFGDGRRGAPTWYEFHPGPARPARAFLHAALNGKQIRVTPHMFRRGYGTIYIYRFELAELSALSQKFEHFGPAMILPYITDAESTQTGKTLAALWSAPREVVHAAHKAEREARGKSVSEAAGERLRRFVADVVAGSKVFSGGFVTLVGRFHRALGHRIDYRALDSEAKSAQLYRALDERGHTVYPMSHTTCMAGSVRARAACGKNGAVFREDASLSVCGRCPYSLISEAHLRAAQIERQKLEARLAQSGDSVAARRLEYELNSLTRMIDLQQRRIYGEVR